MNEEMIKQIDSVIEELNKLNSDYQERIDDKSKELAELISSEKTTIKSLSDEIEILNKTIAECQKTLQESRTNAEENNKLVEDLRDRFAQVTTEVSSLEERLSNIADSSKEFLTAKQTLDSFLAEQAKIKVEISAAQARLKECQESAGKQLEQNKTNEERIAVLSKQIDSIKQTDFYKAFIEGNADLKNKIMDEFLEYVIGNAQVKNAAFKSKLEIERKQ